MIVYTPFDTLYSKVRDIYQGYDAGRDFSFWKRADFLHKESAKLAVSAGLDMKHLEPAAIIYDLDYILRMESSLNTAKSSGVLLAECGYSSEDIARIEMIAGQAGILGSHKRKAGNVCEEAKVLSQALAAYCASR